MKQKIILLLILFLTAGCINIWAYVTYPIAVLSVDNDTIEVGQTINATVEITIPPFAQLLQNENDIYIEGWEIQDFYFKQDVLDEYKTVLHLSLTTFDSSLNSIPRIKLSYVNKVDLLDDSFFCDKFYFFTNSVPIKISSIVSNYQRDTIFDVKNMKKIKIPLMFYILCILLVIFVLFVVYRNIFIHKTRKYTRIKFSPKESAIRDLNNIFKDGSQLKTVDIEKNYCLMSKILKKFIISELKMKKIEMTTAEILSVISKKDNFFYKYYQDISKLFKVYDNAKYSLGMLAQNEFLHIYYETRKIILNSNFGSKENINEKIEDNR